MHHYSYVISLRLWHPSMDPRSISQTLGMEPRHSSKAGEPRCTPKGSLLEGVYRETYWSTSLLPDGEHSSEGTQLEDYLGHLLDQLVKYTEFFSRIRSDGGRVELFVGTYGSRNFGFEFAPHILRSLVEIGLTFSLDVYPYQQN
jgi:hypothetical protein